MKELTQEAITAGNILISEFMGRKFQAYKTSSSYAKEFDTYAECLTWIEQKGLDGYLPQIGWKCGVGNYNSSWNSLIPVIEKISKLNLPDYDGVSESWQPFPRTFGMINNDTGDFMFRLNRYFLHQAPVLIDAAYAAVVEFLASNPELLKGGEGEGDG